MLEPTRGATPSGRFAVIEVTGGKRCNRPARDGTYARVMPSKTLPFGSRNLPTPHDRPDAVEHILVEPWSRGVLTLPGQFSKDAPPPRYEVRVIATNKAGVRTEHVRRGTADAYTLTVEVDNRNDSDASVTLELVGGGCKDVDHEST